MSRGCYIGHRCEHHIYIIEARLLGRHNLIVLDLEEKSPRQSSLVGNVYILDPSTEGLESRQCQLNELMCIKKSAPGIIYCMLFVILHTIYVYNICLYTVGISTLKYPLYMSQIWQHVN